MGRCVSIPVSYLRLEQLAARDLSGDQSGEIHAHLDACDACRGSFDAIAGDRRVLPRLELATEVSRPLLSPARLRWLFGGGALMAAAAALLFVILSRGGAGLEAPSSRVATVTLKGGGEMVLSVIRERGGAVDTNASFFREGDRLKVALTCTAPGEVRLDVAVFQGRDTFRPLGATPRIRCGNNAIVPGAFTVTGTDAITVCVLPDPAQELSFENRSGAACLTLEHQTLM